MRSIRKPAVGGAFLLTASFALMAQAPAPVPGMTASSSGSPLQQRTTIGGPSPLFHLFGLPVVINAPVARSYCGACAYTTFGGQPTRTAGAVAGAATGTMTEQ